MQGFQLIMNFLVMPMFFLSGSLFPLTGLPPALAFITRVDPLTYGIDLMRGLLINMAHFPLTLDLAVLAGMTIIFLGLGSYFFSKIEA
jgi:ABC-2 type transport system permease protein